MNTKIIIAGIVVLIAIFGFSMVSANAQSETCECTSWEEQCTSWEEECTGWDCCYDCNGGTEDSPVCDCYAWENVCVATADVCVAETCVGEWEYYVDRYNLYAERTVTKRGQYIDEKTKIEKKTFGNILNNTVEVEYTGEHPLIHIGNRQKPDTRHL